MGTAATPLGVCSPAPVSSPFLSQRPQLSATAASGVLSASAKALTQALLCQPSSRMQPGKPGALGKAFPTPAALLLLEKDRAPVEAGCTLLGLQTPWPKGKKS